MSGFSRLTAGLKGCYALPAFVLAIPTIPVHVLLPTFYAEAPGLGLATVGTVMFGLRILDVLSDPMLGWVSDRVPIAWGRRKLPMALGGLFGAPALIMLFSPPEGVTAFYLGFWGGVLFLAWTAVQIPYLAWAVELEPDYQGRSRLNGLREAVGLIGILAASGGMILLTDLDTASRLRFLAWTTMVSGAVAFAVALRFVPEFPNHGKPARLAFPWKNKIFIRLLGAWFVNGLANGLPAVCLPLFLTRHLRADERESAVLLFVYFLFAVLAIPLWTRLSKAFGKHRVWCCSMMSASLVFTFVPVLGPGDLPAFGVVCALTGATLGGDLTLPPAIQADAADWDRLKFRQDRTATLFSYWSMATKLAIGAGVGIAFPTLGYFGLDNQTQDPTSTALAALVVIYAVVPIVLKMISVAMMWTFPIDERRHRIIRQALDRHA